MKEKERYEAPEMEIIRFTGEDVITASVDPNRDIEMPEMDE